MVDYVRELALTKYCNFGKYGLFEHLLFSCSFCVDLQHLHLCSVCISLFFCVPSCFSLGLLQPCSVIYQTEVLSCSESALATVALKYVKRKAFPVLLTTEEVCFVFGWLQQQAQ